MGLGFLDVAIGMTFLFLMLSLICSAINELIAALLKARARFLERGIRRMLQDDALVERFYHHPLVSNLSGDVHPWLQRFGFKDRPAYIPARSFALALMDLVQPGIAVSNAVAPAVALPSGTGLPAPTGSHLAAALAAEPSGLPAGVRHALVALVQASADNAVATRQSIEGWYNSTMDRVSGAYKRRTQFSIFFIGLFVTLGVNADSVAVYRRLTTDKTLGAAVSRAAEKYTRSTPADRLENHLATLDSLGLPLGWDNKGPDVTSPASKTPAGRSFWPRCWLLARIHWAGWLLTAFAVSFGAPFWFDVLNRFMIVRSTVKPQEKSLEEPPKN